MNEVGTSPMLPEDIEGKAYRRRIIVVKNKPEYYESPSLMIPPDIVKEYEKGAVKVLKDKCPISFLALPLQLPNNNRTPIRAENIQLNTQRYSNRSHPRSARLLKRQYSDNHTAKKTQRMFDYNDILNITTGKIYLK